MTADRSVWTALSDTELLAQCELDTYRASGPGGQKRNKTSSAVRIRHLPSGLIVISEESRSQHENREQALRRMRKALWLELRSPIAEADRTPECIAAHPDYVRARNRDGRLSLGHKNPLFWPVVGLVLDLMTEHRGRVSEVATAMGISTGNLIRFLDEDPKVWQSANRIRVAFGQKNLKAE